MATTGAETYSPDQVQYESVASDGACVIEAGIVVQNAGTYDVSATRVPTGDCVSTVVVPIPLSAVNTALSTFVHVYASADQTVTPKGTEPTSADKEAVSASLLNTQSYARNDRDAIARTVRDLIAQQIADEFRSADEVIRRVGLTSVAIAEAMRLATTSGSHLLSDVIDNIDNTTWTVADASATPPVDASAYSTYGSQLLLNIILAVNERKASRLVPLAAADADYDAAEPTRSRVVFAGGDEIVIYIHFRGNVRVSGSSDITTESFGLTTGQVESGDLTVGKWLRLVLRLV